MTPKEKAQELCEYYYSQLYGDLVITANVDIEREKNQSDKVKSCAIYCVDEIIELLKDDFGDRQWQANEMLGDWKKVREEIEKL